MLQKVFLIDDDDDDILIHQDIIEEVTGCYCVDVAYDGVQAIEKIKGWSSFASEVDGKTPDLIFLDINMPRMDGLEFLERFEELPKDRKGDAAIFILTTSNLPEDREKSMKFDSVKGFITKPLEPEVMEKLIEEHFAES